MVIWKKEVCVAMRIFLSESKVYKTLGNRVEVKNMNSIRNVKRAIDGEVKRQIDIIEAGGTIEQQTRGFNPADSFYSSIEI
jgi:Asp-tRNA(Asn)/Glu-tRNA(Gln) amidotransferase B subunit